MTNKMARVSCDDAREHGTHDVSMYWDGADEKISLWVSDAVDGPPQLTPEEARQLGLDLLEASRYFEKTEVRTA